MRQKAVLHLAVACLLVAACSKRKKAVDPVDDLCARYVARLFACDPSANTSAPNRGGPAAAQTMCRKTLTGDTSGASPNATTAIRAVYAEIAPKLRCVAQATDCTAFAACQVEPKPTQPLNPSL